MRSNNIQGEIIGCKAVLDCWNEFQLVGSRLRASDAASDPHGEGLFLHQNESHGKASEFELDFRLFWSKRALHAEEQRDPWLDISESLVAILDGINADNWSQSKPITYENIIYLVWSIYTDVDIPVW